MKQLHITLFLTLICTLIFFSNCDDIHKTEKPNENNSIKSTVLLKSSKSWDNYPLKNYPKGKPEITILKIIIPPKKQFKLHKHPVINGGVVLKGQLTVIKTHISR